MPNQTKVRHKQKVCDVTSHCACTTRQGDHWSPGWTLTNLTVRAALTSVTACFCSCRDDHGRRSIDQARAMRDSAPPAPFSSESSSRQTKRLGRSEDLCECPGRLYSRSWQWIPEFRSCLARVRVNNPRVSLPCEKRCVPYRLSSCKYRVRVQWSCYVKLCGLAENTHRVLCANCWSNPNWPPSSTSVDPPRSSHLFVVKIVQTIDRAFPGCLEMLSMVSWVGYTGRFGGHLKLSHSCGYS